MKKIYLLLLGLCSLTAFSQNVTITKIIETGCSSPFVKSVELYVDGTVDFASDVTINYMQNGDPWADNQIDVSALGVQTDSFVYLVRDIPLMQAEFPSTTFDASNTVVVGSSTNGDDGYQVVLNGTVVSQFGKTETDADNDTESIWQHSDAVATRLDDNPDLGTWDPTHWDITPEQALDEHTACQGAGVSPNLEAYFASLGGTFPLGSYTPPATGPTSASPVPTEDPANVVSIYSDAYTDLPIANYDPNWGQSGHMQVNTSFDPTGSGTDFVLAYPNFNYQGTDFGSNEDLSDMDFLHVDIWVEAGTDRMVKVSPINNGSGAGEFLVEVPLTPGSWNSVTLDKADFTGMTWDSVFQLKFDGQFNADGTANTTPFDIYVDNIYFSQTPPPPPGIDCSAPIVINSLPYNTTDDTANYGDDFDNGDSDCSGFYLSGDDVVYSFTPAEDGNYNFLLSNLSEDWSGLHVLDGCIDASPTCVGFEGNAGSADRELDLDLSAGTTYYIVISTWAAPQSTSYTLDISENTCTDASVNYTVVNDCDNSGGFLIDVEVTDMGSATALTVSNDQDASTIPVTSPSTVQVGPFTNGTDVVITVSDDDDPSCTQNSSALTQDACPPENDNCSGALPLTITTDNTTFTSFSTDAATGGPDEQVDCDDIGTNLGVWYTFTAPATELEFLQGADGDPGITIYEGPDCDNLTEITTACLNNDSGTLSGLTVGNDYFAMVFTDSSESNADFVLYYVDCPAPTNLVADNITTNSADLTWTAGDTETEWEVLWGPTGFDPATEGTLVNDNDGTLGVSLSGLSENTPYDFYVTAVCGSDASSVLSESLTFTTLCSTFPAPYAEDFNADPTTIPDCWSQGTANQEDWEFDDDPAGTNIGDDGSFTSSTASGGGFAWVDDSNTPEGINTRLESPFIDVSGLTVPALSFYYISNNQGDTNVDFKVEVWDGAAWNQVFFSNQNTPNGEWQEVSIDISTLNITGDIQVAFVVDENLVDGDFNDDIAIDDVSVDEAPPCLVPTGITSANTTLDSVDISWIGASSASDGYLWYLYPVGADVTTDSPIDNGSTADSASTSVSLTDLTPGTAYDFYVESNCGSVIGTSGISSVFTFSTLTPGTECGIAIDATVASYGDDSQPINIDTTGLPDMSSVPSCEGFDSTEQGLWYEFTTNATPGITLNLLSGDPGDLEGAIYDACGGTELFCFADGNQQDFTSEVLVTGLAVNTTYVLQLYTESFPDAEGAFSLAVTDLPPCTPPQNLALAGISSDTATISWDEVTNATNGYSWEVYASPSDLDTDTPLDSGTLDSGSNTVEVDNLNPENAYDFYVFADCDTDGTSTTSGPLTFETLCTPFVPDYLEDFASFLPNCWQEAGSGDPTTGPLELGTSLWAHDQFLNASGSDNSVNLNLFTDNREDWLISPIFDLSGGDYQLKYIAAVTDFANGNVPEGNGMGSDDEVQVLITEDNGVTWTALRTYNQSDFPSETGDLETIDLSAYNGNVRFAFWGTDGAVDDTEDYDFFIDEFEVRIPPPPANDNVCDAIELTVGALSSGDAYTNEFATAETDEPVPDCFNGGINGSVWFTFVAPDSGEVTVTTDIAGATLTDTEVAVYDAPTDCADLTTLGTELGCNQDIGFTNYQSQVDLTGLTPGNTYYIQVDQWGVATPGTFGIRVLDTNPPCPEPTNLSVSDITADSATLNWDDVVEATNGYEWSIYTSPSDINTDTPVATGSTDAGILTDDVMGLMAETTYDFYISSDCDVDGISILSNPFTFTTDCATITPNYLEEFANFVPNCWSEASEGDPITGPTAPGAGDWIADGFLNNGSTGSARINLYNTGTSDWLLSPRFDLSAGGYELIFDVGITAFSDSENSAMGSDDEVQLLYSDDNGMTWNNLITWNAGNEPSNSGELAEVDLSAITGSNVQFAFWATEGTVDDAEDYNIYVDNFEVRTPPTCPEPQNPTVSNITLDSADLSWDEVVEATTGYNWSVYASPSEPSTDTPVASGSVDAGVTTASVSGLMPNTDYDFYLEADCGSTDGTSVLVGPVTFSTVPDFCGGDLFYDNGGPGEDYESNSNETITISPSSTGDVVTVSFTSFSTEFNYDGLLIYDGPDTSAPLIDSGYEAPGFSPLSDGTWTGDNTEGSNPEGLSFISTHPSGSLTFVFTSDPTVTDVGWEATVTCGPAPTPASVQIIHNSADPTAEFVDVYVNGVLTLDDFEFRTATPFVVLPADTFLNIDVAPSTSTDVSESIYNLGTTLASGETYVAVANGVIDPTQFDDSLNTIDFGLDIFTGAQQASTNPGENSILIHHGATDAPTVDIVETSVPLGTVADDISYTEFQGYADVPNADYVINVELADNSAVVASYEANLDSFVGGNLSDQAITVLASGFLDPAVNQNGAAFGLWAALPTGGALLELPEVEAVPMIPAPDPTEDPANVISMYSGVYTDVPVDTWLTPWSSAQLADIQIQGNDTKLYTDLDFAGVETVANPIDASGMDFFHIDVWSPNATTFRVKLVNDVGGANQVEGEIAFSIAQEQWVSLQIPLNDFADPALVTDSNNLLTGRGLLGQLIISGLPAGAVTAYVDNVYFSDDPSISTTNFDRNNFNFYPNPTRNLLNFETSSQVEKISIYNILGQQVMQETPNSVSPTLNVDSLQSGTYIMNVTIEGASKNFKFVKE